MFIESKYNNNNSIINKINKSCQINSKKDFHHIEPLTNVRLYLKEIKQNTIVKLPKHYDLAKDY